MSSSENETSKTIWISYVNAHDLVTNNNAGSQRKKILVCGFGRNQSFVIPTAISGLCFKFYHDDFHDDARVNMIDLGFEFILRPKRVFKDMMYREILNEWSLETGIPLNHLAVYNYTKKQNGTMRPIDAIMVDLGEDYNHYLIRNSSILTNRGLQSIQGIHHRIGDVSEEKRSFLLLDERKLTTLIDPKSQNYGRIILVALKYFDILEQKMYFVDWLKVQIGSTTFDDIVKYVASKIIPNNKWNGGSLYSLYDLYTKMREFEENGGGEKQPKIKFYDEKAEGLNTGNDGNPSYNVDHRDLDDTVDSHFYNGDIFVFQINPFHPYFSTLQHPKMTNHQKESIADDKQQRERLPLYFESMKQQSKKDSVFWYETVDGFIQSLVSMTHLYLKYRDKCGWKRQWTNALVRKNVDEVENDLDFRRKITRSTHKWTKMDNKTTFGMIRERLGSYYNIKPKYIEIWIPGRLRQGRGYRQDHRYVGWNFGSSGRGKWNKPLFNERSEWRQLTPLQFEFVAYNVKDLDEMSEYHINRLQSSSRFSARVKSLALFNLHFYLPSYPTTMSEARTIITVCYRKDWTARDFIQSILNQIIENPLFLYAYFGRIVQYIRENDMEDQSVGDIEIVRNLSPNRFVIVDEEKKQQTDYHMDDEYKMPDSYSQIKYTDFRVQFLAKNDPLVLQNGKEYEEVDNTGKLNSEKKKTFGLWVHIMRPPNHKFTRKIRVVIEEGESFKNLILRDIWPYVVMNKLHSLSLSDSPKDKVKYKESEKTQDDLMKSIIESKVRFRVFGVDNNNSGIFVEDELLNLENIGSHLKQNTLLTVLLPKLKADDST